MIEILIPTTPERAAFLNWLRWNIDKQTCLPPGTRLTIDDEPSETIGEKRQRLLERSTGDVLIWVDDDDWQHPDRIRLSLDALRDHDIVVNRHGYFLDIATGAGSKFEPALNLCGIAVKGDLARSVPFASRQTGEDTEWVQRVLRLGSVFSSATPLSCWICHDENTVNTAKEHVFDLPPELIRYRLGTAWGDTSEQMAALRRRVRIANEAKQKTSDG